MGAMTANLAAAPINAVLSAGTSDTGVNPEGKQ
jgi:hypothetical protein